MRATEKVPVVPEILRQHVEGAAFLWEQRARMFYDPAMDERQIGRTDFRISAHLDACLASGSKALEEAERRFDDFQDAGETFSWLATSVLGHAAGLDHVLERIAQAELDALRGASGAIAWVGSDALKPYVSHWAKSTVPFKRWLALTAFSAYRVNPGALMDRYLDDPVDQVRARALRLVGEIGLSERMNDLRAMLDGPEDFGIRYFSARSLALLGDREAARPVLQDIASGDSEYADAALELVILVMPLADLLPWMGTLIQKPDRRDAAIEIAGAIRHPSILDWLLNKAKVPDCAAAVTRALRNALPFNLDHTDVLESETDLLPEGL
ncbi:HEAT repeat domain-containing protein [Aestuariicoccus sp. MJ-SS9]|uniref:HEAT repeat domain-containing protein n=1 Tax=Aestuariicoccus sp. MJ-SS9 TaxID=3079855 RepID=UPI00291313C2|nr:HEAT repeat domain-containing protein [Aestuariicoccus sp. MJ-SS9]MDU8912468.1 HEAT repeat domain-containing protein [Aestuariicoccus sp. MJ-SS9]